MPADVAHSAARARGAHRRVALHADGASEDREHGDRWIPRTGVSDPYSGPTLRGNLPKGLAAVFTKGNTRYLVVSLTALAGLLASLGGSWFDGS
jgi:hypothetical protein